jgi:hypothetical protein
VGGHFVPFSLFTTWHNPLSYLSFVLIVFEKDFAGLNAGIL